MRKTLRILFALERLEQDQVVIRSAHTDLDLALAVTLCLDPKAKDKIAPATHERIAGLLQSFKRDLKERNGEKAIVAKRRLALQNLLNTETSDEQVIYNHIRKLSFTAGHLLFQKKREEL